MTASKGKPTKAKPKYVPTPKECAALENISRRVIPTAPQIVARKNGDAVDISLNHLDQELGWVLLMEALGSADPCFVRGLINQLSATGLQDEAQINFLLSVIKDVRPKDHLETMLAAQMAVVHVAAMTFAERLPHSETLQEQDSIERALNKLTRTFTIQIEALKRYRNGPEAQVTVQNVSVGEGGQAIVGNVTQTQSEKPSNKVAPPLALSDARTTAMPIIEENKERV